MFERTRQARVLAPLALVGLGACSWLGAHRPPPPPPPTQLVVTGSPAGSRVFIDGVNVGDAAARSNQTQVLDVAAGTHEVAIELNDKVVYREDTYVAPGERHVVIVKSGFGP